MNKHTVAVINTISHTEKFKRVDLMLCAFVTKKNKNFKNNGRYTNGPQAHENMSNDGKGHRGRKRETPQ